MNRKMMTGEGRNRQ